MHELMPFLPTPNIKNYIFRKYHAFYLSSKQISTGIEVFATFLQHYILIVPFLVLISHAGVYLLIIYVEIIKNQHFVTTFP